MNPEQVMKTSTCHSNDLPAYISFIYPGRSLIETENLFFKRDLTKRAAALIMHGLLHHLCSNQNLTLCT